MSNRLVFFVDPCSDKPGWLDKWLLCPAWFFALFTVILFEPGFMMPDESEDDIGDASEAEFLLNYRYYVKP